MNPIDKSKKEKKTFERDINHIENDIIHCCNVITLWYTMSTPDDAVIGLMKRVRIVFTRKRERERKNRKHDERN